MSECTNRVLGADPSRPKAAVEGRLPRGVSVSRLFDAPVEWSGQHQMLGLAQ
jgi:site-specific DNA recombinase